jgi:YVTN family beta-propeller protein
MGLSKVFGRIGAAACACAVVVGLLSMASGSSTAAASSSTAYVSNFLSNSVTPIEVATNKPGPEIQVGIFPIEVAITLKPSLPTSKDECKNGGWENFGSTFKNQGDCVSFVATGGHGH